MARRQSVRQELLAHGPAQLAQMVDDQRALQEGIWGLGRDLVLAGTSYAALGRLLGTSQSAARQRFHRAVEDWRSEHGDVMPWEVDGFVPPDVDEFGTVAGLLDEVSP